MAAGTWKLFYKGKQHIGKGLVDLSSTAIRMSLHRTSASTFLLGTCVSTWASIPAEISATGNYPTGGRTLSSCVFTLSSGTSTYKFSYKASGVIFTGSGASLNNIRFAVIRRSTRPVCWVALSTAQFNVASSNTLTIKPATAGVFTMT